MDAAGNPYASPREAPGAAPDVLPPIVGYAIELRRLGTPDPEIRARIIDKGFAGEVADAILVQAGEAMRARQEEEQELADRTGGEVSLLHGAILAWAISAVLAGLLALAIAGSSKLAFLCYLSSGFLISYGIRRLGKGVTAAYGIVGVIGVIHFAVLGNLAGFILFVAGKQGVAVGELLGRIIWPKLLYAVWMDFNSSKLWLVLLNMVLAYHLSRRGPVARRDAGSVRPPARRARPRCGRSSGR